MSDNQSYVTSVALPTDYEREILDILIEECAEVIQRATKMKRFGVTEVQPGQPFNNRDRLSHEVGDLRQMIEMAEDANLLSDRAMLDGQRHKEIQLQKFMQFKKEVTND